MLGPSKPKCPVCGIAQPDAVAMTHCRPSALSRMTWSCFEEISDIAAVDGVVIDICITHPSNPLPRLRGQMNAAFKAWWPWPITGGQKQC